jgi:hypothetical protein
MTTKIILLPFLAAFCAVIGAGEDEKFVSLFNGKDLTGWVNANCAPETWTVQDGLIHCTGVPTGALRTDRQYENFILEVEWRHLKSGGNSGVFIWGSPMSPVGVPFLRGIEVQVLDDGFNVKGKNEWYTTQGDIFPIHGATMKPVGRVSKNGQRSFPTEDRTKPSPEWNHYHIECNNGTIRLHINGKQVSGGDECNYRKGYLALESEGAPVEFRNIRIRELPTTNTPPELTAPLDLGFRPLYTGLDLRNWKTEEAHKDHWIAKDFVLEHDGKSGVNLVSEKEFGDIQLIVDWRTKGEPKSTQAPGLLLRGKAMPAIERKDKPGTWNRYLVTIKGDRVTVALNDTTVIDAVQIPGLPTRGTIGLEAGTDLVQYTNIFVRPLE